MTSQFLVRFSPSVRKALFVPLIAFAFAIAGGNLNAQSYPAVAVDDFYIFENNPLYIGRNDQFPEPVAWIVTLTTIGQLVNNGQTVGYIPNYNLAPYVDSFTYKWCGVVNQQNVCSNTATVTIVVYGSDESRDFGSCQIRSRVPSAPTSVGQPVNVTNGNMWLRQSDYALPGPGEPIEINRFYNSRLESSGLFGFGWTTKYDEFLSMTGDLMLKLTMPDGKGLFFARPNTGTYYRLISEGTRARVDRESDGTYTLTFVDGSKHKFDTTGRLVWQRDGNGNQTTLSYNSAGDLFVCFKESAMVGEGGPGDECQYINQCQKGGFCAAAGAVTGCPPMSTGCCTPFCPVSGGNDPCQVGEECTPFFEMGTAPPDYEDVGVCVQ